MTPIELILFSEQEDLTKRRQFYEILRKYQIISDLGGFSMLFSTSEVAIAILSQCKRHRIAMRKGCFRIAIRALLVRKKMSFESKNGFFCLENQCFQPFGRSFFDFPPCIYRFSISISRFSNVMEIEKRLR